MASATRAEVKPGIPYPTVYIINHQGIITHRFVDPENYTRPSNEEIREELSALALCIRFFEAATVAGRRRAGQADKPCP